MLLYTDTQTKGTAKYAILLIVLVVASFHVGAQFDRFKDFEVKDGICHPFIYNISQDKNGFIWLGTGEGLCRFDGFNFESYARIDSLANNVVNVSYKDSFGNLWFGYNNGLVMMWDGEKFIKHTLPAENLSRINAITQSNEKDLVILTQRSGCFAISGENNTQKIYDTLKGKVLNCISYTKNDVLIGTNSGLEIFKLNENKAKLGTARKISELNYIGVTLIEKINDSSDFLIGTEDEGVFLLKNRDSGYKILKIGEGTTLAYGTILDAHYTSGKDLWICTNRNGLVKLSSFALDGSYKNYSVYDKENGFSTNFVRSILEDREGNLWVGTYSNGVSILTGQAFSFVPMEKHLNDNNILSVASNNATLWLGGENGIVEIDLSNNSIAHVYTSIDGLPNDEITALYSKGNTTWIGTRTSGIYRLDNKTRKISRYFNTGNLLGNSINDLLVDQQSMYAATKDGIYNFDLKSDKKYQYNTSHGLPHNDIKQIFIDNENRLLFATKSNGIYEIDDRGEVEEYFTVGQYELKFNSITEDVNNNVWMGTFGQGLFLLLSDTVLKFTARDGLKSDYCYSIIAADSNYLWVGHRLGLSRININNYSIKVFDVDIGIQGDCNTNAVSFSAGKLFFGTTDGLIQYDITKGNKVAVQPKTNLLKLVVNDQERDFRDEITLPYGSHKVRIEFIGLNYSAPSAVQYQFKLEGYDLDWSDLTNLNYASYPRLDDGEYSFYVKSIGYGHSLGKPILGFKLKVKLPIWKKWWFLLTLFGILIFTVVIIIKYRERRQKNIQEYLEKSLDERTREVVEQKEEIEIKNRDITDSINYAQRIQTSILPPIKKLQQSFSGSFIYYLPRDIVSGDFYWFDKVSDSRFVIVCADSTGHGVPGAFMSMIGTTLIKDICNSQQADSPADILSKLDEQLTSTLHQNANESKSNDGMDIMVCEIDINTNFLRYSSAMRPMIVYKNGEQVYLKGSRNSIGGQYDPKEEKKFENEEIQLNKGDLIYMFSDGYPDQFGGPLGKKFKMVRLKSLLKEIHKKPMEEQYEYVKSTFKLWREDYEQVDDVLFMGIKL